MFVSRPSVWPAVAHRFAADGEVGGSTTPLLVDVVVLDHLHRSPRRQPGHVEGNEARVIVAYDVGRDAECRRPRPPQAE